MIQFSLLTDILLFFGWLPNGWCDGDGKNVLGGVCGENFFCSSDDCIFIPIIVK